MKDQILKIAKVKSEKEFYKKYPTEEAFMAKHGKALKKAAMGAQMVNDQLHQLTDWGNPPIAQGGIKVPDMSALYAKLSDPTFQQNALSKAGNLQAKGFDLGSTGMSALTALPDFISGIQQITGNVQKLKEADRFSRVANVVGQAATTRDNTPKKYVRPEDYLVENPYSQGTGYTGYAANGTMIGGNPTEIQNTYAPGNLYGDLGYEPLNDSNPKQYKKGGKLQKAGIGSSIGSVAGTAFGGPLGAAVGSALGGIVDTAIEGGQQAKIDRFINEGQNSLQQASWQSSLQSGQFNKFMEDGGWVSNDWQPQVIATFGEHKLKDLLQPPHDADMLRAGGHLKSYTPPSARAMFTGKQMAMGGDLQVLDGGYAEPISYNPYMPGTGETVMFRGRSHDDGGIPIQYGQNGVEVEGGEPMFQMEDGGPVNNTSGVVAGNIKIDKFAAQHIEDPKAEGKKYKNYIADLSKVENKQNKLINKSTQLALDSDANSPFDQLSLNSAQANIMGANMKLNETAIKKMNAAAVQNAILDTAKELGVKSDKLAQGKFEKETDSRMAKNGKQLKKAQKGTWVEDTWVPEDSRPTNLSYTDASGNYFDASGNLVDQSGDLPGAFTSTPSLGNSLLDKLTGAGKKLGQTSYKALKDYGPAILSQVSPWLRPSNQEPLDPSQLYPEMFALGSNQLEPVRAQQFQPMLQNQPSRISLQDQINTVDSQANAAIRAAGQNPAAQAQIMAQAIEAKNRIKGEEFRMNQQAADQTYAQNRQVLNDAQLRNLQLLDQQYVRQAEAKSKTKAQAIEALKSIATKTAQNKLENRQLGIYENLYNYRFGPKGQAYNVNPLAQFNIPEGVGADNLSEADKSKVKDLYEKIVNRDKAGNVIGSREKTSTSKTSRNGSIVKALKTL